MNKLYSDGLDRQLKLKQLADERDQEVRSKANKPKIDSKSQMIVLKKLENQVRCAVETHSIEDHLDLEGIESVLEELNLPYVPEFGTVAMLDQDRAFGNYIFSLLIILLETQLTQQQAIRLLKETIAMEIEDLGLTIECPEVDNLVQKFREFNFRSTQTKNKQVNVPKQEEKPRVADTQRFEQLYENSKHQQAKRRELEAKSQEDPECSFKPELCKPAQRSEDTFQRLYQNAQQIQYNKQRLKEQLDKQREEEELSQCTFKPRMSHSKVAGLIPVRGEDKVIERLQKARELKAQKENFYSEQQQIYSQHKAGITQQQPFRLTEQVEQKQVKFYVDVKLNQHKKSRIAIKEGDTADNVAANFAKIHSLNQEQCQVLRDTLLNYLN